MPDIVLIPLSDGYTNDSLENPNGIDHYVAVSTFPDNPIIETYVLSLQGISVDSYNLTTLASTPNVKINFISVELLSSELSDAFVNSVQGFVYIGATAYVVLGTNISVEDILYKFIWHLNPSTNLPWTLTDFATLQFGSRLNASTPENINPLDGTVDSSYGFAFLLWEDAGVEVIDYTSTGDSIFLSFTRLDNAQSVVVDSVNKLLFVIASDTGVHSYSYDVNGNLTAIDIQINSGAYTRLAIDPTNRILAVVCHSNGLETFLYGIDGTVNFVDTEAGTMDFVALDVSNRLIFTDRNTPDIRCYTYNAVGILALADTLALPNDCTGIANDSNSNFIFVINANQLRSISYTALGILADVDNDSTNLTNTKGIGVWSSFNRIWVSNFGGSDISAFSHDGAGAITHLLDSDFVLSPTTIFLDDDSSILFCALQGAQRAFISTSYNLSGALDFGNYIQCPVAPRCFQSYLKINFSYAGEVVSNFDSLPSDEIHVNQDYSIVAQAEYGKMLDGCTTPQILYKDPNGGTGTIGAIVVDQDKLMATVPALTNSVAGKWRFKLYCVLPGGEILEGIPFFTNVQSRWGL